MPRGGLVTNAHHSDAQFGNPDVICMTAERVEFLCGAARPQDAVFTLPP